MSMPTLTLEKDLAEQLGVAREVLAELREKLTPEIDWARQGNFIGYTAAGLEKIARALALESPEPAPGADVRTVFVVRRARHNRRLVFVTEKKEGGPELPVRVRNAGLFVPGQEIVIRPDAAGLHLHGRQPRRKGRL